MKRLLLLLCLLASCQKKETKPFVFHGISFGATLQDIAFENGRQPDYLTGSTAAYQISEYLGIKGSTRYGFKQQRLANITFRVDSASITDYNKFRSQLVTLYGEPSDDSANESFWQQPNARFLCSYLNNDHLIFFEAVKWIEN